MTSDACAEIMTLEARDSLVEVYFIKAHRALNRQKNECQNLIVTGMRFSTHILGLRKNRVLSLHTELKNKR